MALQPAAPFTCMFAPPCCANESRGTRPLTSCPVNCQWRLKAALPKPVEKTKMTRSNSLAIVLVVLASPLRLAPAPAQPLSEGPLAYVEKASLPNKHSWFAAQFAIYRKFPKLDLTFRLIRAGRVPEAKRELD